MRKARLLFVFLHKILAFLNACFWLLAGFLRAIRYDRRHALTELGMPSSMYLNSAEKRRMKHYYYGTTYLSVVFCSLRGRWRTQRERFLFIHLSALACFFDDLTDAFRHGDNSGTTWKDNPEAYGQSADPRGIALHCLHRIYQYLPPADLPVFKNWMHRVFNVETTDRQHRTPAVQQPEPDADVLWQLTAEKGGCSVLLFRCVLAHPLSRAEQEALWQWGAVVQLCDDIFDVWFDRRDGILTLPLLLMEQGETARLEAFFGQQTEILYACFARLRRSAGGDVPLYSSVRTNTALHAACFLVSLASVCLRHYKKLALQPCGLPLDDRRQMVVDMERWDNRLHAALAVCRQAFIVKNDGL